MQDTHNEDEADDVSGMARGEAVILRSVFLLGSALGVNPPETARRARRINNVQDIYHTGHAARRRAPALPTIRDVSPGAALQRIGNFRRQQPTYEPSEMVVDAAAGGRHDAPLAGAAEILTVAVRRAVSGEVQPCRGGGPDLQG